ncbi:MAG: hypothetical protein HN368_13165 [Spirochaetales bacterium]|jgi:hypothetical protein|nr:hypothetical protein [Spirochaetales bacterium]
MRKNLASFMVFIFMMTFIACTSKESAVPLVPADYSDWQNTIEELLTYEIPGHTLKARMIYINDVGTTVLPREVNEQVTYNYPEGTIIIKENYASSTSETPDNITMMIKDSTHPEAKGGWIWIAKDMNSGEEKIPSDEFCFACHQNANQRHPYGDKNTSGEFRDYVFYPWTAK